MRRAQAAQALRIRPLLTEGFLHRADLLDAGWSPDAIRAAVAAEDLVRAGRPWILLPEADAALHRAAATGTSVTCVTAARHLGLWMPRAIEIPHLAVPPGARDSPAGAHAHGARPLVPRNPRSLVDPITNVLAAVAACQSFEHALTVWDSALRTRRVIAEDLAAIPWRGERARRVCAAATADSHSGIETRFCVGMRRVGVAVRQQVPIAGHRVDALVGRRIVVQIDGYAHHSDPRQRRSDIAHDRALQRLGFLVLRFDSFEIMHDRPRVEATVLRALAREEAGSR